MWRTNAQNQVSTCVTGSPVPSRAAHARVLWSGHRSGRPRTAERVLGLPAEEKWRPGWQISGAEVRSRLEDARSCLYANGRDGEYSETAYLLSKTVHSFTHETQVKRRAKEGGEVQATLRDMWAAYCFLLGQLHFGCPRLLFGVFLFVLGEVSFS